MNRRKEREKAFLFLFENLFNSYSLDEMMEIKRQSTDEIFKEPGEFATDLYEGVKANEKFIDENIEKHSVGWKKDRISKVAMTILRLAIYEILFEKDTPYKVAVNEAVELSKKYGQEEESSFINGILGSVCKEKGEE